MDGARCWWSERADGVLLVVLESEGIEDLAAPQLIDLCRGKASFLGRVLPLGLDDM